MYTLTADFLTTVVMNILKEDQLLTFYSRHLYTENFLETKDLSTYIVDMLRKICDNNIK